MGRLTIKDMYNYWLVQNKKDEWIGSIQWDKDWKQYIFHAMPDKGSPLFDDGVVKTVFTSDCMREIADIMDKLPTKCPDVKKVG